MTLYLHAGISTLITFGPQVSTGVGDGSVEEGEGEEGEEAAEASEGRWVRDEDLKGIGLTTGVKKVIALLAGGDKKKPKAKTVVKSKIDKEPKIKTVEKPKTEKGDSRKLKRAVGVAEEVGADGYSDEGAGGDETKSKRRKTSKK
jgi:hypothetical protein